MGSAKVFLSCLVVLILFNVIFYLITTNGQLVLTNSIFSSLITLGLIAVVASVVPFTGGETALRWFFSTLLMVGIVFGTDVTVLGYTFPIGIGLGSNMINLFSADVSGLGMLPFLFFTFISLIATISGIMLTAGGGD
jgi:hypothetical protein